MRILFATPAYWPAVAFGGPIWVARELNEGLVRLGHSVDVVTTTLTALGEPAARRTAHRDVGGVRVHYLGTPLRYRWMGIPPSLPLWLRRRRPRPDVVHVFGYRDAVTTTVAAWCRLTGTPYVFEPLGMRVPRFRNLGLKRTFDRLVAGPIGRGAAVVVAVSELDRRDLVASGIPAERIAVRPNGFPDPTLNGEGLGLRRLAGVPEGAPLVLSVGRIARNKGLDLALEAIAGIDGAHLVVVGPDQGDGTGELLRQSGGRVHVLPPLGADQPLALYADADVFLLPSRYESFGSVAAEAAAAGTPVVLTDHCGIADLLRERAAVVVRPQADEIREAVKRLLGDDALRARLGAGGREVAREVSWPAVVRQQEELYRAAVGA